MKNLALVHQLKLELIRSYEPMVRTVAGLTGRSLEDAREAFHAAICRMLVGLTKRPPGNPVLTWRTYIVQAVVNQLRETARRQHRLQAKVLLFSELSPEDRREVCMKASPLPTPLRHLEDAETSRILWTEVATLDPHQAEVLRRWSRGADFKDIAASMRERTATVYKWWSRGIARLRRRPRVQQLAA